MDARLTLRRLLVCAAAIVTLALVTSACGGGSDTRAAANDPQLLQYSSSGLSFSYPAAWTAYAGKPAELHFDPLVYLSTQPVHDPCSTHGNETTCGFPVGHLQPGGVLVVWERNGIPAMGLGPGTRIRVDGRPASMVDTPGGECSKIGADRTINVTVETSAPPAPFIYLTACLREPGVAGNVSNVNSLLASTKFLAS